MRTWLLVLAACLTSQSGAAQGTDSLTVDGAVRSTLQTNPLLRQAEAQRQAAEARSRQAESSLYPVVSADASIVHVSPIGFFSFAGETIPLYPGNNLDAEVGASATVFDFGRRSAGIDAANAGTKLSDDYTVGLRSALTVQAMQTFYTVMLLEKSVEVQEEQVKALNEHLAITQRRVESGSATDFDALSTSVRVSQAKSAKLDLERALHDQQVSLRRLTGMPWDAPLHLSGALLRDHTLTGTDSLEMLAMRRRPDIHAAQDALEAAKLQARVAGLGDAPSLHIMGSYGIKNGFEPNIDAMRGNWVAGVSVAVPIFSGFLTRSKEEEASAQVLVAERKCDDVKRTAEAEIRQSISAVQSTWEKIATTELQVRQAVDAAENARVRYESGAGTNLDLLDAETNVSTARLQLLQSLYQYQLARIGLDASIGAYGTAQ